MNNLQLTIQRNRQQWDQYTKWRQKHRKVNNEQHWPNYKTWCWPRFFRRVNNSPFLSDIHSVTHIVDDKGKNIIYICLKMLEYIVVATSWTFQVCQFLAKNTHPRVGKFRDHIKSDQACVLQNLFYKYKIYFESD